MINEKTNNATILAKRLIEDIKNENTKRKSLQGTGMKYSFSEAEDELALFKYKRYLGSLRCILDTKNMRSFKRNEY